MMKRDDDLPILVIGWLAGGLVALLSVFSFALSYTALRDLAKNSGAVMSGLDLLWPLVIDFAMLVFALVALYRALRGEGAIASRGLVLLFAALSVAFNVAHAPQVLLSQFVAAMPPVALVLSFESLLDMIARAVGKTQCKSCAAMRAEIAMQNAQIQAQGAMLSELQNAKLTMEQEIPALQSGNGLRKIDTSTLRELCLDNGMTATAIAQRLGVATSTITRSETWRELRRNGNGKETQNV